MNIAIIDDERPARSELKFLLSTLLEDVVYYEADSAQSALALMSAHSFQAVFLDISLGDVKGTTLACVIHNLQPHAGIVFVTAHQSYAVEAFNLDAVDYILKPFDMKRLGKSLDKLRNRGYLTEESDTESVVEDDSLICADKIAVHGGDRLLLIPIDDIVVVETSQRGCLIHTKTNTYEENVTLNQLMNKLQHKNFFRVHKSYLVNLDYVEELVPSYNSGYAMKLVHYSDRLVPISRSQLKNVRKIFTIQ